MKIGLALDKTQGREALVQSLKDELSENRADLLLRDAKGDAKAQETQVKDLLAQGIQALIVLPVDSQKAAPLVQTAHKAGIKVLSLGEFIPDSQLDYLIAFNEHKAGELQARAMVKKVPKGNYVLLGGEKGFQEGQREGLEPLIEKGDIQVLTSRDSKRTASEAEKEMAAILKTEGKKVEAVLIPDGATAAGVSMALSKTGLSGKVQVAGTGQDLRTCQGIASGTQTLTVYYPPKKIAEETAYLAAKVARKAKEFDCQFTEVDNGGGKTLEVLLTPVVVDAKNLDSTIIQDGVQKREEVYGK